MTRESLQVQDVKSHERYRLPHPENIDPNGSQGKVLAWVPPAKKILELGPGPATITRHLKPITEFLVCIEADPAFAEETRPFCDELIRGNIEDPVTWERLRALGYMYDLVICADVLEHLVDPWAVLRTLKQVLHPTGRILASIPNIAHWSVRWELLRGHFKYQEEGLLDRTHLRFFTLSTIDQLFRETGYAISRKTFTYNNDIGLFFRFLRGLGFTRPIERWANSHFPTLMSYQVIVEASPSGGDHP